MDKYQELKKIVDGNYLSLTGQLWILCGAMFLVNDIPAFLSYSIMGLGGFVVFIGLRNKSRMGQLG